VIDKKEIRNHMKAKLTRLSKPVYEDLSNKIAQTLFIQEDWKEANVVGITISRFPEVDTYHIIRKAWEAGKQVAVPKCLPSERKLAFRIITHFSQLESVYYGLSEPIESKTAKIEPNDIDLLIVPGLGFTREGCRLGFGGGYYDRFLPDYHGKTISLAFDLQLIPTIPVEEHDQPVQKIITNHEVIIVND